MIVKLFDGREFVVDKVRGEEIARGMMKKDNLVRLGGGVVRSSAIATVLPGGYSEADLPKQTVDPSHRLKSDNRSEDDQYKAARKKAASIREVLKKRQFGKLKKK